MIINVKAEDKNQHIAYSQITLTIEDENDVKPQLDMVKFLYTFYMTFSLMFVRRKIIHNILY